jgi:ABC-type branched-subunit amino acid transport system substrate-binding protein
MSWRRITEAASVLVFGGLLACSCGSNRSSREADLHGAVEATVLEPPAPPPDDSLRIAAVFPTMGRYAISGGQSLNGARLAVMEVNRSGGIHGRKLHLLEYRTGSYFVDARRAASLAAAQGALAIVGSNSSELSRAVAEEAEARGIVQVSNVSTAYDLTFDPATGKDRPFVFRVCSSDAEMGAQLARFAVFTLGARRAAVLFEVGRSYSSQLARSFIEVFRAEVSPAALTELRYLTQETDFRPQLREALDAKPDVLFIPGSFTDATLVASQALAMGLVTTLIGADGWSNPLLFSRGAPPGRAWFVDLCEPRESFASRYREAFGSEAYGCRALLASDAVRSVVTSLRGMGPLHGDALGPGIATTRRQLRDRLALTDVEGETGRFRFDANGDRSRGVVLFSVDVGRDGKRDVRRAAWLGAR